MHVKVSTLTLSELGRPRHTHCMLENRVKFSFMLLKKLSADTDPTTTEFQQKWELGGKGSETDWVSGTAQKSLSWDSL